MKDASCIFVTVVSFLFIGFITGCDFRDRDFSDIDTPPDITAPEPGSGISVDEVYPNSVRLRWTEAEDDVSLKRDLQYRVYYSAGADISSVEHAEANGSPTGGWQHDIGTATVNSLSIDSPYHFNVIVRDEAGNKSAYSPVSGTPTDLIPPEPGNGGIITISAIRPTGVTLTWTTGTDNFTPTDTLEYLVYYVLQGEGDISTVEGMEAYGTPAGVFETGISTGVVGGLVENGGYFFNVMIRDAHGNRAAYSRVAVRVGDIDPPVPGGGGIISFSGIQSDSVTMEWTAANDNITARSDLGYMAYFSLDDNISDLDDIPANGTPVGPFQNDITSITVTGLNEATTYYFNVIVRDQAGNTAAYTSGSAETPDVTAPTAGTGVTVGKITTSTVDLSWTAASDNLTAPDALEYQVYYSISKSNNLITVEDVEKNGKPFGTYTAGMTSVTVTDLSARYKYWFNVIVRDGAGNKAIYSAASVRL